MPAILAHWAVAKEVAWSFINNKKPGYILFQGEPHDRYEKVSRYVYFGANGPDLPYFINVDLEALWRKPGESLYADLFHYNKQAEFILQLVLVAKNTSKQSRQQRTMAYALGHVTHLAADAMVHPYVNCFAGSYSRQTIEDIHKTSELHQDSFLAREYFGRSSIRCFNDAQSWRHYLPECFQAEDPELGAPQPFGYTLVMDETKEVLHDINSAFEKTHGLEPGFEYLKDCYQNLYSNVLEKAYDTALVMVPEVPHNKLVQHGPLKDQHGQLKDFIKYYPDLLCKRAVDFSEKLCDEVIALYQSGSSKNDLDKFRTRVKNINMDNGYWIDIKMENNVLKIIWRHTWCEQKPLLCC